ncbi:MAG: hypothetical protein C0597_04440 [Marinilabiliales bacterium]|nr:MAG: hypothetical protein C0597_04440 [Marinilabiliales bacterium]
MITYSLEKGIFEVEITENVTFEEIINYLKDFSELNDLPSDILLLYDLTKINVDFSVSEIRMISHAAELSTKKYNSIKSAFVVDKPKLAAYTSLFSDSIKDKKTTRKIFSTRKAALTWLNTFRK